MNFDAFLPSDISAALMAELDIMKEAATSGTMDVSGAPALHAGPGPLCKIMSAPSCGRGIEMH